MMNNAQMNDEDGNLFKIGVISGKGGVGKTTVTGSLALLFKEHDHKIIASDCDVDAPNLGLLFKGGKKKDVVQMKTTEKSFFVPDKCISCKRCIDEHFCNFHSLSWNEEQSQPVVDELACEGCGACYELCPEKAFEIKGVNSGNVTYEWSPYEFPLVWGETKLGATTSGKLVTEIKKYVSKVAKEEDLNIVLIDGPPGIGCPVVATVSDLDYVVIVMEPTSTALHDGTRAIDVLTQLNRKFGIVINKADAWKKGNDAIKEFTEENGFTVIGEIPVDEAIPNATVKGVPVYHHDPNSKASDSLKKVYNYLVKEVIPVKFHQS